MTVQEIVSRLGLKIVAGSSGLEQNITGGYGADLLSNAMGQAKSGSVWVTMQGHQNVVAVASLVGMAAVIIAGAAPVEPQAVEKARQEGVVLLTTPLPAFEVIGRLYGLGITGQ
ncbi:MAG: DRTGG domain-containing protein [Veillonellales bacterium]